MNGFFSPSPVLLLTGEGFLTIMKEETGSVSVPVLFYLARAIFTLPTVIFPVFHL